jgi:hypothetical protein
MKNNNKNLDEIFGKARNLQPEVSKDEIHNLFYDDAFIKNYQIKKKNFKGARTMYLIAGALSIAAIVGGLTFNTLSVPESPNIQKNNIKTEVTDNNIINNDSKRDFKNEPLTYKKNNDMKAKTNSKVDFAVNAQKSEKPIEIDNKMTSSQTIDKINIDNPMKIDGLKVIELNQEQFDKLGISVDKNGKYIEVYLYMKKNIPTKHQIFVDWGVGFNEKDLNSKPQNSKIIFPNFISDNSGNRRIQVFNDDDNVTITDTRDENSKISYDKSSNIDIKKTRNIRSVFSQKTNTSKNVNEINIETSINTDKEDDIFSIDSILSHSGIIDNNGKLTIDEDKIVIIDVNDPKQVFMSNDSNQSNIIFNKDVDDIVRRTINSDSCSNLEHVQVISFQNFDSPQSKESILPIDSTFTKSLVNSVNKRMDKLNERIELFNQKTVNKLIPVAVPVPNATDRNGKPLKDFKFILWFEPSYDFLSVLPDEICSDIDNELELLKQNGESCSDTPITGKDTYLGVWQGCNGAIENLRVYPNPTDGPIAVDLMLKEKRNLKITLHDLTGRKISDLNTGVNAGAGEFNARFELKKVEPGVYLVVVQSEIGERAVQRVIVGK